MPILFWSPRPLQPPLRKLTTRLGILVVNNGSGYAALTRAIAAEIP